MPTQYDVKRTVRFSSAQVIFGLSILACCAKVFGFAEKVIIAHFFGTSATADVYFAAMGIVLSLFFLVKELVYPSLLPVFAEAVSKSFVASAALFRKIFLWVAGFGFLAAVLFLFCGSSIGRLLVPGFSREQQQTTSGLLMLAAPALVSLSLMVVTYTVLNARRRFLISAAGESGFKILMVGGLAVLLPFIGVYAAAVSILSASVCCLVFQLFFIPERSFIFKAEAVQDERFKKVLSLMLPLTIGVVFSHIGGLVDNLLASQLPQGQLSSLNYAKKIVDAALLIGPVAGVTVFYSELSNLAGQKKIEQLAALINKAFRVLLYLAVPAACVLIQLRKPLLRCLFEHGQFTADSTTQTAAALLIYGAGFITFSLEALLTYSFYALCNTKTPVKLGVICVILHIILAVILLRHWAYLGIAAALVISKTVKILLLIISLARRIKGLFGFDIIVFLSKVLLSTSLLWGIVAILGRIYYGNSLIKTAALNLIAPVIAGFGVFAGASYLLGIEEFKFIVLKLREKAKIGH